MRIAGHGFLDGGDEDFRRRRPVGMHLDPLSGRMVDLYAFQKRVVRDVHRTGQTHERVGLDEAVLGRVVAPVIIAGSLHPRRVALRRAVVDELVRAEQQVVLRQTGGDGLAARDLPAGDVGPDAWRLRGIRILAVPRILPAQRLAVGQTVRVALAALGDAVAVRMHEHAQPQLFPAQGALQLRQLLQDDRAPQIGRGDPGRGVDLRGPRRAKARIGLELIQQRHERAGLQLEQHPRYLAVGILLQSRRIIAVRHLVLFDGGGIDRRDMAGDVHDHDGMPGAGLVEIMAGGMPLLGYLRIIIAPADDGHALRNAPGLLGKLGHQLVHGIHRAPEQRTGKVHLIEIISALTGKMPMPVHKAGIHGLAPQIHAAPDPP